jgi:hypothetical protein
VPKDFYPAFSWDTTPMYYMLEDTQRILTPDEVQFIAERTGFLCIEKSHAMKELGVAELGAGHFNGLVQRPDAEERSEGIRVM